MPVTHGHGNPNWTRDETLLVLDLILRTWPKLPGKHSQEVQALSDLLRGLPIHPRETRNVTFRNVDGIYLKIQNLASLHPDRSRHKGLRTSETDRSVWQDFASDPERVHRLASQIVAGATVLVREASTFEGKADDELEYEAVEGNILSRLHRVRERHRGFRRRVLEQAQVRFGVVACESCELTPPSVEAQWFLSMFELHHRLPLADAASAGPTTTRLADFSILCANCHRVLHAIMRAEKRHVDVGELSRHIR